MLGYVDLCSPCAVFRRFGPESPRPMLGSLWVMALSKDVHSAGSLMSGFGQLLRQASNGDMSQLQQLAKDSTVMYTGFQHRLLNTNPAMATQKHIALYASGFRFSRQ